MPPKDKGRPLPGNATPLRGSADWKWAKGFKGEEVPKAKEKEIRGLDDEAVIRLVRRGLGREVKEGPKDGLSKDEWRGIIGNIIRTLKEEDSWPAFAKACREEHRRWLFWCMERLDDGDGNNDGEE